jgi:2-amino-4-hydroxy-6-hydroxymethyldihydropteridine diphosphokinase
MPLAYIGLGSNLSDPQVQISAALEKLRQLKCCIVTQVSSLYFSRPMGPQDQPDYMNAVVAIELLEQLQEIENMTGRIRKDNRWGARILDLDIILFDQQVINTARLTIPHYGLKEREFVLLPLAEIAPNLFLPDGDSINELASKIAKNGLKIHSKLS